MPVGVYNQPIMVTATRRSTKQPRPARRELVLAGGGPQPSLQGIQVRLPPEGMQQRDGVTYFEVQVLPPNDVPWRVMRRFKHFRALSKENDVLSETQMPPKLWFHDEMKLEARRAQLERWLQGTLAAEIVPYSLNKFLLLGRCPLEESQAPSAPLPEEGDGLYLLEVEVPAGLGPDDLIQVEVPGKETIVISVPWGIVPGQPLQLWWDPVANSLGVHHRQNWQALRK